jgi:hypothetical protein
MGKKKPHSIGTEHESSLHRSLKFRYTGAGGKTEQIVEGFVADGVRDNGEYIEVQTGSFAPLRRKIPELVKKGKVRIIHPIAAAKYIEVYESVPPKRGAKKAAGAVSSTAGTTGRLLYRRKSPLKGNPWNLFDALVYAPELALLPGLCIEIVLLDITEKRLRDGKGSWRRKGVSILDREMSAWHESILLAKPQDYLRFTPFKKNEEFTTALLAERTGINAAAARKTLYVLAKMGLVARIGKQGNSIVYKKSGSKIEQP